MQSTATLTIRNAGPYLVLGSLVYGVYGVEGGTLDYWVERRGDTNVSVSVDYATTAGSASPGRDFIPVIGQLAFAPGERYKRILVDLPDNGSVAVGPKTVELQFSHPTGVTLDPTTVQGLILDDGPRRRTLREYGGNSRFCAAGAREDDHGAAGPRRRVSRRSPNSC